MRGLRGWETVRAASGSTPLPFGLQIAHETPSKRNKFSFFCREMIPILHGIINRCGLQRNAYMLLACVSGYTKIQTGVRDELRRTPAIIMIEMILPISQLSPQASG